MRKLSPTNNLIAGFVAILSLSLLVSFLNGCKNETATSLYDPNYVSRPAPVITSIAPPNSSFAGVGILTITGSNFSPTKEENFIYFDAVVGQVLEASSTQLKVKAPILVKDSIKIRIAVFKAELFSNTVLYKLDTAVSEFGNLQPFEEPWGIACDSFGNLFISMVKNNVGDGIKKITPNGVKSDYAPAAGVTLWSALKVGPSGLLYAARTQRAIFTIAQNSSPTVWVQIPGSSLYDFDFDSQGNLWAGGSNTSVYRIKPDLTVKLFPFLANVRSVRVFNNYLYLGARVDSAEGVFRFQIITSDSLGGVEKYFDLSALPRYGYNGPGVYAITFNSDGDMYLGTDGSDGILLVHPNGSSEPYYPGLFKPTSLLFAWGKGNDLFVTRSGTLASHTVIKVNTLKTSAPYYGRGDR